MLWTKAARGGRRTPWFNQEVKDAIRAKKEAYKAWLGNKAPLLRRWYTEARKVAAETVKASKAKSWKDFGVKLDSDFRSANKVFWQTIRRLRNKKPSSTPAIKNSAGVLLTTEKNILGRWREYFLNWMLELQVMVQ